MKILFYCLLVFAITETAEAQVFRKTAPRNISAERTAAQIEVGQSRMMKKNIDYMLEHYTDGELRNYAKSLNLQAIDAANRHGEQPPAKLSEETLNSRQKIGEYLRSYFGIDY